MVSTILWPPYPLERSGSYCTGGWVGLGTSMDAWKILPSLGFGPQTAQPVTRRYTNCVILATQPSLQPYNFSPHGLLLYSEDGRSYFSSECWYPSANRCGIIFHKTITLTLFVLASPCVVIAHTEQYCLL